MVFGVFLSRWLIKTSLIRMSVRTVPSLSARDSIIIARNINIIWTFKITDSQCVMISATEPWINWWMNAHTTIPVSMLFFHFQEIIFVLHSLFQCIAYSSEVQLFRIYLYFVKLLIVFSAPVNCWYLITLHVEIEYHLELNGWWWKSKLRRIIPRNTGLNHVKFGT